MSNHPDFHVARDELVAVITAILKIYKLQSNYHQQLYERSVFYRPDCPSCCQTNSVKALKAYQCLTANQILILKLQPLGTHMMDRDITQLRQTSEYL